MNKYFISYRFGNEQGGGFGNMFIDTSELLVNNEAVGRVEEYISSKLILKDVFDAKVVVLNFQLIKGDTGDEH